MADTHVDKRMCPGCQRHIAVAAFAAVPRWGETHQQENCWECRQPPVRLTFRGRGYGRKKKGGLVWRKVLLGDPCAYCHTPSETLEHIDPQSVTGENNSNNLSGACAECNLAKGNRFLLEHLLDTDLEVAQRSFTYTTPADLSCRRSLLHLLKIRNAELGTAHTPIDNFLYLYDCGKL